MDIRKHFKDILVGAYEISEDTLLDDAFYDMLSVTNGRRN